MNIIKRIGISGSLSLGLILCSLAGSSPQSTAQAQAVAGLEEGKNYLLLPGAETKGPSNSVTVTEMFGYFCPHCFHLQSELNTWNKSGKPAFVKFDVMPVVWQGQVATAQLARLYYTVVALHREADLHDAIFNEIHVEHRPLMDADSAKAEALQAQFLAQHGVSAADFAKTYHSADVDAAIERARAHCIADQVLSVPTIVVAEKYVTDLQMNGDAKTLFQVVNELANRQHSVTK